VPSADGAKPPLRLADRVVLTQRDAAAAMAQNPIADRAVVFLSTFWSFSPRTQIGRATCLAKGLLAISSGRALAEFVKRLDLFAAVASLTIGQVVEKVGLSDRMSLSHAALAQGLLCGQCRGGDFTPSLHAQFYQITDQATSLISSVARWMATKNPCVSGHGTAEYQP
jgi:hypothetical protein